MRLSGVSEVLEFDPKTRGAKRENVHAIPGWALAGATRIRQWLGVQMPGVPPPQLCCQSVP